jgi:hypothetical protein
MSEEELRQLPATFNLPTAARALGIGTTKAYQLARAGEFPCPVLPLGSRFRVTKHHLFEALGMPLDNAPAVKAEAQSGVPSSGAPFFAAMPVPEGGVPVVLVLQAVVLPGGWEQLAAMQEQNPGRPRG